jgi:hypothetical protein
MDGRKQPSVPQRGDVHIQDVGQLGHSDSVRGSHKDLQEEGKEGSETVGGDGKCGSSTAAGGWLATSIDLYALYAFHTEKCSESCVPGTAASRGGRLQWPLWWSCLTQSPVSEVGGGGVEG